MQNYFGPFYFGELKPYNSKYCSNFVLFFGLQLIFVPFNFAALFGLRNSRNKGHANIKGFTVPSFAPTRSGLPNVCLAFFEFCQLAIQPRTLLSVIITSSFIAARCRHVCLTAAIVTVCRSPRRFGSVTSAQLPSGTETFSHTKSHWSNTWTRTRLARNSHHWDWRVVVGNVSLSMYRDMGNDIHVEG